MKTTINQIESESLRQYKNIPGEQIGVEQLTPVHPTLQDAQVAPLELLLHVQTLGAEQLPPFKQGGGQVAKEQVQKNPKACNLITSSLLILNYVTEKSLVPYG